MVLAYVSSLIEMLDAGFVIIVNVDYFCYSNLSYFCYYVIAGQQIKRKAFNLLLIVVRKITYWPLRNISFFSTR